MYFEEINGSNIKVFFFIGMLVGDMEILRIKASN